MPSFKVRSAISHGTKNDKGEVESKDYNPGDTIELTKEEALTMSHALEKAPTGLEDLPKDVQEAVKSVRNKPEHRDSGVQLDWKVDDAAREALGGTRQMSPTAVKANEAIGAGYERSNEPDATSGEEVKGRVGVRASEIAPGEEVSEGEKKEAPKDSAAKDEKTAQKLTETKSPASISQTSGPGKR
jgi:hypothetical protein